MKHGDLERLRRQTPPPRSQRGGIAPLLLGSTLLVLLGTLSFGLVEMVRAMDTRSTVATALRSALRASATTAAGQAGEDVPPAWDAAAAVERFHSVLADNLSLDAEDNPVGLPNLLGPVTYDLRLLAPGETDPGTGAPVPTPTAIGSVQARMPLLLLSRFTGGPVPVRVLGRCRLIWAADQWRIADN